MRKKLSINLKFNLRKTMSWLLILLLLIAIVPAPINFADTGHRIIIHYQRDAKDYDGWNLWLWEEGQEGKAVEFSGDDVYGKVLILENAKAVKYGFIVRKGNWESKDVGTDRFIEAQKDSATGVTEVWLKEGKDAIETKVPEGAVSAIAPTSGTPANTGTNKGTTVLATADKVTLKIHYRRFDQQYEGWNLWLWPKTQEGKSFGFTGKDEFGAFADVTFEGIKGIEEIGMIVRKGEWEAKDVDSDRFINISKVDTKGIVHVYVVQGTAALYDDIKQIDLSPKFLKAEFMDDKTVRLVASMPLKKSELRSGFILESAQGHRLTPIAISASGETAQEFVMILSGPVNIGQTYQTKFLTYKPLSLDPSGLYSTESFEKAFAYHGKLGADYQKDQTTFRVWSPVAQSMVLNLYHEGHGGKAYKQIPMVSGEKGTWEAPVKGDLQGVYYTFTGSINGVLSETYDPYAASAGVNGDRSMVVNFKALEPEGWMAEQAPIYEKANDIVVYEMHIRDFTNGPSTSAVNKGKYLGVIEAGTKIVGAEKATPVATASSQPKSGTSLSTGIDHLKELGITHVQILPMFDYNSIDETRLEENLFNWGYDPKNYSVPEGSYASNPYDGRVRVKEMRQMIQGLHSAKIGVIMDVVYNHTALSGDSNLNKLVPSYYYRMKNGEFTNGSGTGNETASERAMVRKLMIDSLKSWVINYDIDGFRFDLMGLHDTETMLLIEKELRAIKPDIILYGEGWTGGTSPLSEADRLVKKNMQKVSGIGAFNDDFRDAVKGHVFEAESAAFIGGVTGFLESLKFGFVGAGEHPQIDYSKVNYSKRAWTDSPSQSINYVTAHDNLTLWDKLLVASPEATDEQRVAMHQLGNAMVLMSQGVPFLHAGDETLRTKNGDHNSYKSSDAVNNMDWTLKEKYQGTFTYYQGLIALRKAHPQLRLETNQAVQDQMVFFDQTEISRVKLGEQMVGLMIGPGATAQGAEATTEAAPETAKSTPETLVMFFNGSLEAQTVELPLGSYQVLANGTKAGALGFETIKGGQVSIPATSALVLTTGAKWFENPTAAGQVAGNGKMTPVILVTLLGVLIFGGVVASYIFKRRK